MLGFLGQHIENIRECWYNKLTTWLVLTEAVA